MLEELKLSLDDGKFYYSKQFDELGYREYPRIFWMLSLREILTPWTMR